MPNTKERSSISIILILGFTTLIILIVSSGFISAYQVSLIRSSVTNLEQDYLNQLNTVLKVREIISQIYIEAREAINLRRTNPSAKPLVSLPSALKPELEKQMQIIEETYIGQTSEWKTFKKTLKQFINTSINPLYLQINGFAHQQLAFNALDEVTKKMRTERTKITEQSNALQLKAEYYIITTTTISLLVGLSVAVMAVVEIQRRFRQLQQSFIVIDQAREFNQDIINGVVNALFTLDAEGKLTSANQAFYELLNLTSSHLGQPYQDLLKKEMDLCKLIEQAYERIPSLMM
ncbi:MAG: hypothetical protein FD167_668 [bacterium]|nr:MAG: hypothetical protein FD167_668 [bacterium]